MGQVCSHGVGRIGASVGVFQKDGGDGLGLCLWTQSLFVAKIMWLGCPFYLGQCVHGCPNGWPGRPGVRALLLVRVRSWRLFP